jgi:hypothetical protein
LKRLGPFDDSSSTRVPRRAHEVPVVARHDDRARVRDERLEQGVDALHVEVVGGLVEQQHVVLLSMRRAMTSRAASPPERFSVFLRPASPLKSSLPSTERTCSMVAFSSKRRSQS